MRVFISWSGSLSRKVGELFNEWLPNVIQTVDPWFSPEGIAKGEIWFSGIADALANTTFGILCLTKDNLDAPWILFEAGALCKGLSKNRVCPIVIDFEIKNLTAPLNQFNGASVNRAEIQKLVNSINDSAGAAAVPKERVAKAFERLWPDFEEKFGEIIRSQPTSKKDVSLKPDEMTEEILETVRSIHKTMQAKPSFAVTGIRSISPQISDSEFFQNMTMLARSNGIRLWAMEEHADVVTLTVSEMPSDALKGTIQEIVTAYGKGKASFTVNETGSKPH